MTAPIQTLAEFAKEHGLITTADVDGHIHAGPRSAPQTKTYHRRNANRLASLQAARDATVAAYRAAIASRRIREATSGERLLMTVAGHPDNLATQAAQRVLAKRAARAAQQEPTVKFDLKKPCANCPFRSDIKFWLRLDRVEEILDSITQQQQTFACHKTTQHDDDGEHVPRSKEQHCAGALIMLERMNKPNQMMRISERLGMYDRHGLDMTAPVFGSAEEMLAHDGWERAGNLRARVRRTKPQPANTRFGIARPRS
jgi:hypothetical protein